MLLSPYFCFISLLYLHVYVHGEKALIPAKQTSELKVRLAAINILKPSGVFSLTIPRWCFFCGSFLLYMFHFYPC